MWEHVVYCWLNWIHERVPDLCCYVELMILINGVVIVIFDIVEFFNYSSLEDTMNLGAVFVSRRVPCL